MCAARYLARQGRQGRWLLYKALSPCIFPVVTTRHTQKQKELVGTARESHGRLGRQ